MRQKKIEELFRKERRLQREIRRKKERYEELVTEATSTGSFRYDQERVKGSSPDGSRQERIIAEYLELEEELKMLEAQIADTEKLIGCLISKLPERERRVMKARHVDHEEVESIMRRFNLTYETYKTYHRNAVKRMEKYIDSIPQI